jgi:two-component system phosphate regulon response regulator OmpR
MDGGDSHILVVDDDRRLRQLLQKYLTENGYVVTTATDAADARARLMSLAFDLLVVDVMMPGEDGLSLTRSLRQEGSAPILMLTARGEVEDRIAGLESGAEDYLVKPFEPRELLLRINNILRRAAALKTAAQTITFGAFSFDVAREELRNADRPVRLTSSESDLLKVFAGKPGEVLSREWLSHESRLGGGERTVDVQVARLRRKIEVNPKDPRYLQTVWGTGYVLRAD